MPRAASKNETTPKPSKWNGESSVLNVSFALFTSLSNSASNALDAELSWVAVSTLVIVEGCSSLSRRYLRTVAVRITWAPILLVMKSFFLLNLHLYTAACNWDKDAGGYLQPSSMGGIGGKGLYVIWQSVVDYSSNSSSVLLEISTSDGKVGISGFL